MKKLLDWIDRRTGLGTAVRDWLARPVAGGPGWRFVWPSTIVFMLLTQALTGLVLWMYYSPGAQSAWESVYYLQYHVAGGWLLRAIHHVSAQATLVLVGIYLLQMIVRGAYRPPREFLFWTVLLMGLVTLGLNLTGDLLAWDQNSYWSTHVRTSFLFLLPGVGQRLFRLAVGGSEMGSLTLTRFLALHIGVLTAALAALVILHAWLARRHGLEDSAEPGPPPTPGGAPDSSAIGVPTAQEGKGQRVSPQDESITTESGGGTRQIASRRRADASCASRHPDSKAIGATQKSDAQTGDSAEPGPPPTPYWPRQAVRDMAACAVVLAAVLAICGQHGISGPRAGVELGAPANPTEDPGTARPEWSFRGLFQFRELFPASLEILPIFIISSLTVLVFFCMPLWGARRAGYWFNLAFTAVVLAALVILSWRSYADDAKNEKYQAAVTAGRDEAERVKQLADSAQGIPASGALAILRDDPKTQGPRLFQQFCASCHDYTAPEAGRGKGDRALLCEAPDDQPSVGARFRQKVPVPFSRGTQDPPSAPNLYQFASRDWVRGLLDPREIAGPKYFGNTKFKKGKMANYVKTTLKDSEPKEVADMAMALSAEAGLPAQHSADAAEAAGIAKGKATIAGECTDCHKFYGKGTATGPDLTGYGSRQWLLGIISNPAHKRFYGKANDRMPAYADAAADPASHILSPRDLGLMVDWLRGQW